MAFAGAFRRILSGSSAHSPILHSQFASVRHNSTLTAPKLFVSGSMEIADGYSIRNQKPENAFVGVPVYENPSMKTYSSFATDLTGLSRSTTDENLFNAFASFGKLREAKVIVDRASGRSKGFGFVTYETVEEAEKAREGMNAKFLDGWVIFVDPARPREPLPRQPPKQDTQPNEAGFTTNKTIGWCG